MARKAMLVSDLSGQSLTDEDAAKVSITINGERWDLDVARSEVDHLIQMGRKTKVRGRKKKQLVEA